MSGAQVVPIFAYNDTAYLDDILSKVNGVLFTGGGIEFDIKHRWTANADHILKYAIESNKRGNPFPIWGTCLGFELLAYLTSGYDSKVLAKISNETAVTNTIQIL
jgi:gamma-glutamyl hydrolase